MICKECHFVPEVVLVEPSLILVPDLYSNMFPFRLKFVYERSNGRGDPRWDRMRRRLVEVSPRFVACSSAFRSSPCDNTSREEE